jgi:hypothetical protein
MSKTLECACEEGLALLCFCSRTEEHAQLAYWLDSEKKSESDTDQIWIQSTA